MPKRTHTISMRLNDDESKDLDRRRGRMQRGRYLRSLLKDEVRHVPEINREAYRELARAAGNINQLARKLNSGIVPELHEVRATLTEFRNSLIGCDQ